MENTYESIVSKVVASKPKFETGKYISLGWKNGLPLIGWIILYGIIVIVMKNVLQIIPVAGELLHAIFVAPVMGAGLMIFIHNKVHGGKGDFGLVFKGFTQYTGKIIGVNLLGGLIIIAALIPGIIGMVTAFDVSDFAMFANEKPDPQEILWFAQEMLAKYGLWILITYIFVLIAGIFLTFSSFFVALGGEKPGKAISLSFKMGKTYFFPILGFAILCGLINLLGVLCLIIGVLVTLPVTIVASYYMFYELVQSKVNEDEISAVNSEDVLDA